METTLLKALKTAYLELQILSNNSIDIAVKTDSIRANIRNTLAHATGRTAEEVQTETEQTAIIESKLSQININQLDHFEVLEYNRLKALNMSKPEALQVIINTVEGDTSQLSPDLAAIAEEF